eukprot:GGOE01061942.1.p1 GENE.GGOE01061942.1~~GGOE01061942.1.p1  ORF type:complete len:399 (-),score=83.75 GGOE01061942.1:77-1273(-)
MAAPASLVRVRFTPLANGLSMAFFHPVEPGAYTLEVIHHSPLPKANWTKIRHYSSAVLDTVPLTVVSNDQPPTDTTPCEHGPFAGRWVLLPSHSSCHPPLCDGNNTEVVNSSWVYAPYDCYLRLRSSAAVAPCLRGKWVLLHGDSTMEENALGFVKDLLQGNTPMKKQRKGDPWRNFDVLVKSDRDVSHFPPQSRMWTNQSVVGTTATRITMRFNPTHMRDGQMHHQAECDGLRTYTHRCRLSQELLDQFRSGRPPDVFIFTSLQWDLMCIPLKMYKGLLGEIAGLFHALHALSPGTLFLFRGSYGSLPPYQNHPSFGLMRVEQYLQAAFDVMGGLPFVRVVDVYDLVKPWAYQGQTTGDGMHLSVDETSQFLHRHVLQLLLHEICRHFAPHERFAVP